MKKFDEIQLPEQYRYSLDHEWAVRKDGRIRVGIDDYAQSEMGDIVYVELPEVGRVFAKDSPFGTVESVKAVSDLQIPVGGEVVAVNTALADSPQLVNQSPYDEGWMIEVIPSDPGEMDALLDAGEYRNLLRGSV